MLANVVGVYLLFASAVVWAQAEDMPLTNPDNKFPAAQNLWRKKPKKQAKLKAAAIQRPGVLLRFVRDGRGYGQFQNLVLFPVPFQFSVITSTYLKSSTGAHGEADATAFTTGIYLLSPHWNDLGAVGYYTDATGVGNNMGRGGLYYRHVTKRPRMNGSIFFMGFPVAEKDNFGRLHGLWGYVFRKRWSFAGSYTYLFAQPENVLTARPQVGFDIWKGLRAIVVYDYNDSLEEKRGAFEPGLELVATF